MNTRREITEVQHRISALEYDLTQLKLRVDLLETNLATEERLAMPPRVAEPVRKEPPVIPVPAPMPPVEAELPRREPLRLAPSALSAETEEVTLPQSSLFEKESLPERETLPDLPRINPLREWLEPLQLWPPSGEANAEVRLAAWWTTRIGALLAVIGVVFLGIYLSRGSPPWVRLAEVAAAAAGVVWLGSWLERRIPKFGAVVFGAGLALVYFMAFGAYAVGPMKVIQSPGTALVCELLAVAGILATAWRRGSHVVATMAVALGHVTAFLALRGETAGFGPWVVLLLGVAAVMLRWVREWSAPSLLALPLAWVFLYATGATQMRAGLPLGAIWLWATLYFILHSLRDWAPAWRGAALSVFDRGVQVANASLAVAVGVILTDFKYTHLAEKWELFFLGSGVILLGSAMAWRVVKSGRELVPVFACKGTGLIALGAIAHFDGHARYLVLLAQAFTMLVSAKQSAMKSLRIATMVVGVVAVGFYCNEMITVTQPGTSGGVMQVAFLVGTLAFVGALRRWLALDRIAETVAATALGLIGVLTVNHWTTDGWTPALMVAVAAAMFAGAATVRAWWPATVAAIVLCVVAHQQLWSYAADAHPMSRLWLNEAVLLATAVLAALSARTLREAGQRRWVHGVIAGLAISTFVIAGFHAWPPVVAAAVAMGLALAMVGWANRAPQWPLAGLSTGVLALGTIHLVLNLQVEPHAAALFAVALVAWAVPVWLALSGARLATIGHDFLREYTPAAQTAIATALTLYAVAWNAGDSTNLTLGAAGLFTFGLARWCRLQPALEASWVFWLPAAAFVCAEPNGFLVTVAAFAVAVVIARRPEIIPETPAWRRYAAGIQVALAVLLGWVTAVGFSGVERVSAVAAVIAVAYATWRWGRVAAARYGVLALTAAGAIVAARITHRAQHGGWNWALTAALAMAGWVVLAPIALARGWNARVLSYARWVGSAAGLILAIFALTEQRGDVAWYATAGCGIFAVSLFVVGLFARSRPHRLVGLGGLSFCVARAFIVDIDSTLYRIVAFVVLGIVLLWVGFSYHRFIHLIEEEAK